MRTKMVISTLLIPFFIVIGTLVTKGDTPTQNGDEAYLMREVHHELTLVPWYTVFDDLKYTVKGSEVTLSGEVTQPTLKTDADVTIGDLAVPKGTYTLFVDISDPDNWVLIVNKKTGEWGLAYDGSQDLGRVKMKMGKPTAIVENLLWTVDGDGSKGGKITLAWEYHAASVPIAVH